MILCRGTHHRGPADVDVLHGLLIRTVRPRDRGRERIEIDDEQVDGRDAVLRHHRFVRAAPPEQAAVNLRMQRLHAPIHDFRESPYGSPLPSLRARCRRAAWPCRRWRAARRYGVASSRASSTQAGLVGDGKQRAADGNEHW